ncbi:MAG: hypothetical protein M3619_12800 [Myxococcota bacterium]|nr:hypothetical protein [Myxococcota bacterium]
MRRLLLLTVVLAGCGDNKNQNRDAGDPDGSPDSAGIPPQIGPEMAVDDPPVNGNTGQNAFTPYVAFNGTSYLAVWSDTRISRDNDIFATRIGTDGTIMDVTGIVVSTDAGKQITPVASWVGDRWLVAWSSAGDIDAATISAAGMVTQLSAVSTAAATELLPAIASSGTTAVVAWQSGADIVAAQWASNNFGSPFTVANGATAETDPAVAAASATEFLVAYTDAGIDIRGRLVASGAPAGASFEISPTTNDQNEPAAAFNGTHYVVTYNNGSDVFGTRVTTTGTLEDASGVALGTGTGSQLTSSVACDTTSCFVAFADSRTFGTTEFDIFGQRTNLDLTLVGANIPLSNGTRYQVTPTVAAAGTGYFTAWEDNRTGGVTLIFGSRVGNGGVVDVSGIVLNTNKNLMQDAAIATGSASTHLVVWSDSRAIGNDIEAVRYAGPAGAKLDTPAKPVSSAINDQSAPSTTFDGTQYLVVWSDARTAGRDIYGSRFTSGGTALDATGIAISTAARDQLVPDVVHGAGVSLVVWQDRRNGDFDIFGAIINPAGAIVATDIAISTAVNDQNTPAVAFDPASNTFVVVWSDTRTGTADIYGARVNPSGSVLDAGGIKISNGANGEFRPDVGVTGDVAYVVWDDRRSDTQGDIYGARLTVSASSLGVTDAAGVAIATAAEQQTSPTIVGLPNRDLVVAWTDNRNLAATGSDIYGARIIAATGQLRDAEFVISNQPGNEAQPALENGTTTVAESALVYQGYRADVGTTRVFRRTMLFP